MRIPTLLTLLVAMVLPVGAAQAAQPETFEPGTGKYILVLKDPRTEVEDRATGKKKAKEPDVAKHGGKVLHKKDAVRIVKMPVARIKALRMEENVAYIQRVWLGESLENWDEQADGASLKAEEDETALETDLTWTTGTYAYDGSGNIKKIGDDTYRYDSAGRLIQAVVKGTSATYTTESYKYDSFGNLTEKTIGSVAGVINVDSSSNRLQGEAYDVAGNMTTRAGTPAYTYDSMSMMDTVTKLPLIQTRRMIYGPDDERIGVIHDPSLSRWKIRDFSGKVLREYKSDDPFAVWHWMEDYVYGDGRLIGGDRESYYGGKRHFHTDHLGSVRMITDQNRLRRGVHDYLPFGVEQTDSVQEYTKFAPEGVSSGDFRADPMKYTSHERDFHGPLNYDNTDYLDYMHARYYDPNMGRFLSVDPGGWDRSRPQTWNRYTYAENNPILKLDPDGRQAVIPTTAPGPLGPFSMVLYHAQQMRTNPSYRAAAINAVRTLQTASLAMATGILAVSRPFIVTPAGTVLPGGKDVDLVPTATGTDWLAIHDVKAHDGLLPHTHRPEEHVGPNGEVDVNRTTRPTTAEDIDEADRRIKDGELRPRADRKDKGDRPKPSPKKPDEPKEQR